MANPWDAMASFMSYLDDANTTSQEALDGARGLTVKWPASVNSDVERAVLGTLDNPWLQNCMDLIDESYALNFWEKGNYVRSMDVKLSNEGASGTLAYVSSVVSGGKTVGLSMTINMDYYSSMDMNDWNGNASGGAGYLDRTIAHEMVHALMSANIENFSSLPKYIKEGAAEVVHGIDDFRKSTISSLAANPSTLRSVLENLVMRLMPPAI